MNAIDVQHLTKVYRSHVKKEGLLNSVKSLFNRQFREHIAVKDVSFAMQEGELVGMLGSNGAGKTTTLKMLSGLLHPSSGSASVLGFVPWERKNNFKRQFSIIMGQRNQLWWDLPAADSFLLNKEMYQIPDAEFQRRYTSLAERLGVADKLHVQVRRLSLGERMKCELIGSLLHAPRVLFLDEPTIGLDVVAQQAVREFIKEYNRETSTSIILTSHYMDDIEVLCKRVIVIDGGRLVFDGALAKLTEQYIEDKVLTVLFRSPVEQAELQPYGVVTEWTPDRASLRINRNDIASAAGAILNTFSVVDLTIEEVPIEDVIREIFSKPDVSQSASR